MQIVDKNCGRTAKPPSATAIATITASIGCIDARDKRVLAVLSTKMSSEEVIGDTSLIFVIIAGCNGGRRVDPRERGDIRWKGRNMRFIVISDFGFLLTIM